MTTDQPAGVSTSAAVEPPGPEPTMMTSKSRLTAGTPPRRCNHGLDVAVAVRCSRQPTRAAVARRTPARRTSPRRRARRAARELARSSRSRRSCSSPRRSVKSAPRAASPPGSAPGARTTGPLNSRSGMPSEPSIRVRHASSSRRASRWNVAKPGGAAEAPRDRATRPDPGRIEGEGTEEAVDVVGHAGFGRSGVLVGRDQAGACRLDDCILPLVEEPGHVRV